MTRRLLDRPVFVIGCNRSGTTLLFRTLSEHPVLWTHYEELQEVFHRLAPVHPERGERVDALPPAAALETLERDLYRAAHNKEVLRDLPLLSLVPRKLLQRPVRVLYRRPPLRMVEKTPANSLRVPLLARAFPDALFVFLVRRPEAVISSLMEGWKGWTGGSGPWEYGGWHYLAPPGWREWRDRPLQEICAFQWVEATRTAWDDLRAHCPDRFVLVRHEDALAAPRETYRRLREFCQLPPSGHFRRQVDRLEERTFTHRGSAPRAGKWKELHGKEVESVREMFQPLRDALYPELRD